MNKQWLVIVLFGLLAAVGGVGTCTKYVGPILPPEPIPHPAPGPTPVTPPAPVPNPNDVWKMLESPSKNVVTGMELPASTQVNVERKFIIVQAKCSGQARWLVSAKSGTPVEALESRFNNSILIFTTGKPNDVIAVIAYSVSGGQPTDAAITFYTLTGNTPPPSPNPTPTPEPTPPVAKYPAKLHVTFLLDYSKQTRAISEVVNSPELRKWLTDQGHKIHELSIEDVTKYNLEEYVQDKSPPLLILQAQGETGIKDGWMPPSGGVVQLFSVQGVKDAVLKVTGKKE